MPPSGAASIRVRSGCFRPAFFARGQAAARISRVSDQYRQVDVFRCFELLAAFLTSAGLMAAPGNYVGSNACKSCHPAEFRSQSITGHARALSRASDHSLPLPSSPLHRPPSYRFQFTPDLHVRVFDATDVVEIPLEWAFGAGEQAVTFVSRIDSDWYLEHYFSFYRAGNALAATPGQGSKTPKTLPEAAGLVYKALDPNVGIVGCFQCHSTGTVATTGNAIQPAEPGVHCEACHGPGYDHSRAGRGSISNPRRLSPEALNRFCGTCHRTPGAPGTEIDWNFAWNVRHQPVYLSQSACFRKSAGKLSCLSCHAPHQPLEHDEAAYNRVCASCHAAAHPGNCVDCHMPRVSPEPLLRFSNHWIGVYRGAANLKPIARK